MGALNRSAEDLSSSAKLMTGSCYPAALVVGSGGLGDEEGIVSADGLSIPEDILDMWDRQGISDEMLQHMKMGELEALQPQKAAQQLPAVVREGCLRFMARILALEGAGEDSFMMAAAMLDKYCLKAESLRMEKLPVLATGLTWLLLKADGFKDPSRCCMLRWLRSPQLQELVNWLRLSGWAAEPITGRSWIESEMQILKTLSWKVQVPCVSQFYSAYFSRISSLFGENYQQEIQAAQHACAIFGGVLTLKRAVSLELTGHEISLGLICHGFIGAGLLSRACFRPPSLSLAEWQELYDQTQPGKENMPPERPSNEQASILAFLGLALRADIETLKDVTSRLCFELKPVLASIKPGLTTNS
eukprot:CAMPEP_0197621866 /NCGR_PEP_ID=MMETSP1338-20131121/2300_1 /TAXON_ID=43686 ORGANISM="Pelagodinium beii, Strain RCC1491" /NCGR_SAMPLE_ID=MMETSP1338 /ASSEMBLY_ACC=CAM_ASM_000754 /LENGTH=359 /DNA_ID=CAMNT_0043191431 /DNA_START=42 /DNA_END=1121 /DNA_ORIENTATION=+